MKESPSGFFVPNFNLREVDSGTYTVSSPSDDVCSCTVLRCAHPGICLGVCGCRACHPRGEVATRLFRAQETEDPGGHPGSPPV